MSDHRSDGEDGDVWRWTGGQASANVNTERGTKQGNNKLEEVVSTITSEFGKASRDIRVLPVAVKALTDDVKDLKRKQSDSAKDPATSKGNNSDLGMSGPSKAKQMRTDGDSASNIMGDLYDTADRQDSNEDLYAFFEKEKQEEKTGDRLDELEEYFEPQDGVGEDVAEKIGKITDRALRGTKEKKDEEKLTNLKQKHLPPKNVPNLQVPKVDNILWRQLKHEIRVVDFQLQKANANYDQALIPVVKAMEFMICLCWSLTSQSTIFQSYQPAKASECMPDAFETLCLHIKTKIAGRWERIRKELQPKFRPLCQNEASATNLFGDHFQEAVKQLEGTKSSLTMSTQNHFLGNKGGSRNNQSSNQLYNHNKYHPHQRHAPHRFDRKPQLGYKRKNNNQTGK